ncbi:DciA family protein [Streptomyces sp. NPDC056883]|uniref:DciA family protein n=1 Tax=Streptomyces sp. NPDC056883 TaxID=3345959 RepID=UPI0036B41647
MSDSINRAQAPSSGVDLARQALAAARAAAQQRGDRPSGSRKAQRSRLARRQDGREPVGFAALLSDLVADRAWELPAAGASLTDQWQSIATDLTGYVDLAGYDADSGELAVRPVSSAYATAVRLRTPQLIAAANTAMGSPMAVRAIRILPPGATPTPVVLRPGAGPAGPPVQAAAPAVEYEQPAGYREAVAQHRAHRYTEPGNPLISQARREQIRNRILEPESAFAQGQAEAQRLREQAERQQARGSSEAHALARARAEKAGLTQLPFQASPPASRHMEFRTG